MARGSSLTAGNVLLFVVIVLGNRNFKLFMAISLLAYIFTYSFKITIWIDKKPKYTLWLLLSNRLIENGNYHLWMSLKVHSNKFETNYTCLVWVRRVVKGGSEDYEERSPRPQLVSFYGS